MLAGKTSTEDECAKLVKLTEANAKGATYVNTDKSCYASFGSNVVKTSYWKSYRSSHKVVKRSDKRYCRFTGIFNLSLLRHSFKSTLNFWFVHTFTEMCYQIKNISLCRM